VTILLEYESRLRVAPRISASRPAEPQTVRWWSYAIAGLCVLGLALQLLTHVTTTISTPAFHATATSDVARLDFALDAFKADTGRYPTPEEGLDALVDRTWSSPNWRGPYIRRPPLDPWGHAYVYSAPAPAVAPHVVCTGPDGLLGTGDDIISP